MDPQQFKEKAKDSVDPYCVVSYAGLRQETHHVEKCCDPVWNEEIKMATCVRLSCTTLYHSLIHDNNHNDFIAVSTNVRKYQVSSHGQVEPQ